MPPRLVKTPSATFMPRASVTNSSITRPFCPSFTVRRYSDAALLRIGSIVGRSDSSISARQAVSIASIWACV